MRHAGETNRKNLKKPYDKEPFSEKREHTVASSVYREAKQRSFFLTGEDVLKSLDTEMAVSDALRGVSYRRGSRQSTT